MTLRHGKGRLPPFVPLLIMRWFRELQHYGFIVMVSPAHRGVNGHGKAPHWRLTEEWYLDKAPTRDFLSWDGIPFTEKRTRDAMESPWSPPLSLDMESPWSPLSTAAETISGTSGNPVCTRVVTPLSPRLLFFAVNDGVVGSSQ
jgi:hypothetical protein